MDRSDFSKPFFMSASADEVWASDSSAPSVGGWGVAGQQPRGGGGWRGGGRGMRGGGWGSFNQQENWNRYNEAYGSYQGGYGPGRGFGPAGPRPMGPPGPPRFGFMYQGPTAGPPGQFGPPRPPGPPGQFGPIRPNDPFKFLQKCGVPVDTLKNMPRELLRIHLPNHCGVCSIDLETYQYARLHYNSKNHLKNQRKWLLENPTGGNSKEAPFKARELYCELCDVQITSKAHADSHYLGKQHLGVVEGRKQPRNLALLVVGAETRLEQLIKREMKFMKTDGVGSGTSVADKPKPKAKKPAKPATKEFFCEICQAPMSCSDQMTAHLNGKRHLSKEKQHILKMMKNPKAATEGAANNKSNKNGNGTAENGNADAEKAEQAEQTDEVIADMKGDEAKAEDEADSMDKDDSWVDGTGEGWDEPLQQGA